MGICALSRRNDLSHGYRTTIVTIGNVLGNSALEERWFLRDYAQFSAHALECKILLYVILINVL